MTDPSKPDPWVGRATPRPVDPWPQADPSYVDPTYGDPSYVEATYVQPGHGRTRPHYVLVPEPPRRRRRGLRVVVAIVGVFAACCAGGATLALLTSAAARDVLTLGTGDGTQPAAQTTPPPSPSPEPPPPPAAPGLNTPVRDGKFEFVVTGVNCGEEQVGIDPLARKAKGQYCVVDLSVQNISNRDQLLVDGVQKAYDAAGTAYTPDTGAGLIVNVGTQAWLNILKPGVKVTGKFVYDVPDGTTLKRLELHDSAFSTGTNVTL